MRRLRGPKSLQDAIAKTVLPPKLSNQNPGTLRNRVVGKLFRGKVLMKLMLSKPLYASVGVKTIMGEGACTKDFGR